MLSYLRKNLLPIAVAVSVFIGLFAAEYARAAWFIDKDFPTTGITVTCAGTAIAKGGTCGATTATVTMTCTDTPPAIGSGCLHIHYSANSGSWQTATSSANPLTDTYVFPITLNSIPQNADVKAHSKDGAGNMECPHDGNGTPTLSTCPIDFPFTFTGVNGWWQVTDGDVMAADYLSATTANVKSLIPQGCSTPQCQPYLGLEGTGRYPGVVAFGKVPPSTETANFGVGTPLDKVAKNAGERWLANSGYAGRKYDYDYFLKFAPKEGTGDDDMKVVDCSGGACDNISGGNLQSDAASNKVKFVHYKNGSLTVKTDGSGFSNNKRLFIFVDGDFNIQKTITVRKDNSFFGAAVKGNINISGDTYDTNKTQPALEGLYMANGVINTGTKQPGTNDNLLYVRGALISWGGINFQRNLGDTDNERNPGEKIEYAPDLLFNFPRQLLREGLVWREIAP